MSSIETNKSVRKEVYMQDQFIRVFDPIKSVTVEILLDKDGNMPIAKLDRRFPGAYCLEYTHPKTGYKRVVEFDDKERAFLPPSDGWGDKTFDVIFREERHNQYPYSTGPRYIP